MPLAFRSSPGRSRRVELLEILALGAALLFAPAGVEAAPLTFVYGGTIDQVSGASPVKLGDRFSGRITFDPDQPTTQYHRGIGEMIQGVERSESDGLYAFFNHLSHSNAADPSSPLEMSLLVGGRQIYDLKNYLEVSSVTTPGNPDDPQGSTVLSIRPDSALDTTRTDGFHSVVSLDHPAEDPWKNFNRLAGGLAIEDMPFARLRMFDQTAFNHNTYDNHNNWNPWPSRSYEGQIDTFQLVQTPEPSTLGLVGLGVAAWGVRRFRSRVRVG